MHMCVTGDVITKQQTNDGRQVNNSNQSGTGGGRGDEDKREHFIQACDCHQRGINQQRLLCCVNSAIVSTWKLMTLFDHFVKYFNLLNSLILLLIVVFVVIIIFCLPLLLLSIITYFSIIIILFYMSL